MSSSLGIYASQISGHLFTLTGSYDALASVTVPSGGVSSVTFAGIPSTYTHLQIRVIGRSADTTNALENIRIRANGDTASNYSTHALGGDGATAYIAQAAASQTSGYGPFITRNGQTASTFGVGVIDILDYTNTSKNKTMRYLSGADLNGSGGVMIGSTAWLSTSSINSITLFPGTGTNFVQYSSFALYGVK